MLPPIEDIIAAHRPALLKLCLGYARTEAEARDLVQEVFITAWRKRDSFRGEAAPKTWLYRVAVNVCLMERRRKRLPTVPLEPDLERAQPTVEPDPQLELLRRAIATLPRRERILMLLYLEELSYAEIAGITGTTAGNVGVKIHRSKEKIRRFMKTNSQ